MNHAANGTGPFAAHAMDSALDDLDIDESLMLDVEGITPTGGRKRSDVDIMNPDEARKAALAALRAADRDHKSTQRSAGMGEGTLNSDRRFKWSSSHDDGFEIDDPIDEEMFEADLNTAHHEIYSGSRPTSRSGGLLKPGAICCTIRGKRITRNFALVVLALVSVIVIIGASVGSSKTKQRNNVLSALGGTPEQIARYSAYRDLLVQEGISSKEDLEKEESPQYKAITFLSHEDSITFDPFVEIEREQFISKYGLILLYYSNVADQSQFLKGKIPDENVDTNEDDYYRDPTRDNPGENGPVDHSHDWLSESDGKDPAHCHWTGVQCYSPTDEGVGLGVVKSLNLTMRGLVGSILPDVPRALNDVISLDLGYNSLTGPIPDSVYSMTFLRQLYLGGNDISGQIPSSIGELKQLEDLYLQENRLSGQIPQEIGLLTQLDGLGLYENLLTGQIPESIGNLQNLFVLYLDDNDLTGPIPETVSNLKKLMDFRVRKNRLSGKIPPEIGAMSSLQLFYVDGNDLTGPIPETLVSCKNLRQIHIYKNSLTGSIPGQLGELGALELFYADNNDLVGEIPATLGYLYSLEALYLFNNKLNSTLPQTFGRLKSLVNLRINNNKIKGPLPSSWGNLTKLELLFADSNLLSGSIPSSWTGMKRLQQLRLQSNNINGSIPTDVCLLRAGELDELYADCGVSKKVVCESPSCCTVCS